MWQCQLDRIKTKLTIDGKKYDLWDYVNEKIGDSEL